MKTILVIEDSTEYREVISDILLDAGYDVYSVPCSHDAFQVLKTERVDLVLCDLHLPFILNEEVKNFPYSTEVGVRTIEELMLAIPEVPVIAVTASLPSDVESTRRLEGKVNILHKPFKAGALVEEVEDCLQQVRDLTVH